MDRSAHGSGNVLTAIFCYAACRPAERFRLPRTPFPLGQDYEDRARPSQPSPPAPQVGS